MAGLDPHTASARAVFEDFTVVMLGRVGAGGREAFLTTPVYDMSGNRIDIEFTVDTGFTGALSLPSRFVEAMGLPFVGQVAAILADGSAVETRRHRARIEWHGRNRNVRVLVSEGGPLVGMRLLRGCKLFMDVSPGGEVAVEERN